MSILRNVYLLVGLLLIKYPEEKESELEGGGV